MTNEATSNTQETTSDTNEVNAPIELAFTGDILLADNLYNHYVSNGINGFLSIEVSETLQNADITFVDQEFPFSDRGTPQPNKEYTYCISPTRAVIFKQMGVDIVALANNHILDYGQDALSDTFNTLEANQIDYVGAGKNLDRAKKLITKSIKGKNIGFLSASRIIPDGSWYATNKSDSHDEHAGVFGTYDSTDLCNEIKLAKSTCDFVVVYVHWGIEKDSHVADYQRILAHDYIDAGADLIVGTHPHIMQGVEYYKETPIVYSLGNFLFSNYQSRTAVLTATINKDNSCSLKFLPCMSQSYVTSASAGQEITNFCQFINEVSYDAIVKEDGSIHPK